MVDKQQDQIDNYQKWTEGAGPHSKLGKFYRKQINELTNPTKKEVIPNSKVGLSLSMCVGDILSGRTDIGEVKEIIASTNVTTPEEWDSLINYYKDAYWKSDPEKGEKIARELIASGKIRQPRTEGKGYHQIDKTNWLDANTAEAEYQKLEKFPG